MYAKLQATPIKIFAFIPFWIPNITHNIPEMIPIINHNLEKDSTSPVL
jgi:hypothetical protein